jgi:hypothetical protein
MRYDVTPIVKQQVPNKLPIATLSILLVTGILTGLQFAFPQVLPALMRTPAAITDREWWRFVTPLFVHADGWKQIAFVFRAGLTSLFRFRICGRNCRSGLGAVWRRSFGCGRRALGSARLLDARQEPDTAGDVWSEPDLVGGRSTNRDKGPSRPTDTRRRRPRSRDADASAIVQARVSG